MWNGTRAGRFGSEITDEVRAFVERHYADPITLRDVARHVGYSPAHLTFVYRRTTGIPVTAAIIERRISAARELLSASCLGIAAVGARVGFNDTAYFARQFRRLVGTTPGRYRSAGRRS